MFSSDQNIERIADLVEEAKKWLELKADYTRLSLVDKVVRIVTALVLVAVMFITLMLILNFLSFAAALVLGNILGNAPLGYLIVGMAYIILLIIIFMSRHSMIERPLVKFLVSVLAEEMHTADNATVNATEGKEEQK